MLYIIGLGAGDCDQLPLGVMQFLKRDYPIYLRTNQHPMIHFFDEENIKYTSFDSIYESYDTFEEVYEYIIQFIKKESMSHDIVYAVPGHPMVAEYTVKRLMSECPSKIIGGQSFLDAMFASLLIDPIDGLLVLDALDFDPSKVIPSLHLIIPQLYDQISASNLKLDLMELYPDEHEVCIVTAAGSAQERLNWLPLYEIDHDFELNNLTTLYVPPLK